MTHKANAFQNVAYLISLILSGMKHRKFDQLWNKKNTIKCTDDCEKNVMPRFYIYRMFETNKTIYQVMLRRRKNLIEKLILFQSKILGLILTLISFFC